MRVYHRLIHIRDQKERHEDVSGHITDHPVFKLTTKFRLHVQAKSAPIGKTSPLVVDAEGLLIFGELATMLREQGSVVMIYLVACLLERLFGKETIDDIESLRGGLTIPELIDGESVIKSPVSIKGVLEELNEEMVEFLETETTAPIQLKPSPTEWLNDNFVATQPTTAPESSTKIPPSSFVPPQAPVSAFSSLSASPNPFGTNSAFGGPTFKVSTTPKSVFGTTTTTTPGHPFEGSSSSTFTSSSPFGTFTSSTTAVPPSSDGPLGPSQPPKIQDTSSAANPFTGTAVQTPPLTSSTSLSTLNPASSPFTPPVASNRPVSSTETAGTDALLLVTAPSKLEASK